MRLSVSMLLVLGSVSLSGGCGAEPPCVDEDDNELNFCEVDVQGVDEPLLYCPGDHWGADDGCNSCGCDGGGKVVCTSQTCTPAE
jgi:hypothetical protein